MSGVGPGGEAGDGIELLQETTDHFVRVGLGAEAIELPHHLGQRPLHFADGVLGVELTLRIEAALTSDQLFPIEIGRGMQHLVSVRTRIGQET